MYTFSILQHSPEEVESYRGIRILNLRRFDITIAESMRTDRENFIKRAHVVPCGDSYYIEETEQILDTHQVLVHFQRAKETCEPLNTNGNLLVTAEDKKKRLCVTREFSLVVLKNGQYIEAAGHYFFWDGGRMIYTAHPVTSLEEAKQRTTI